jgi:hypothetical protein
MVIVVGTTQQVGLKGAGMGDQTFRNVFNAGMPPHLMRQRQEWALKPEHSFDGHLPDRASAGEHGNSRRCDFAGYCNSCAELDQP